MSGFGPDMGLRYRVLFRDEIGIDDTMLFVSANWQMGVDFQFTVDRQRGDHEDAPPQFRVLRRDGSWGDWHRLSAPHGESIPGHGRALQWQAGAGRGETWATLVTTDFEEHPDMTIQDFDASLKG